MPRFAANIDRLFRELPWADRFAAAAAAGFQAVESDNPHQLPARDIRHRLQRYGLQLVVMNTPVSADGRIGIAAMPGRAAEFLEIMKRATDHAQATGCPMIHVVAGSLEGETTRDEAMAVYLDNLSAAAELAGKSGLVLTLKPVNPFDISGYFLNYAGEAAGIISRLGRDNLRLQLDFYHQQVVEGGLARTFGDLRDIIAHVQVSSVPDRSEPDCGEINFPYIFDMLDREGYKGWVGCNYRPAGKTLPGLRWAARWDIGLHTD